MIENADVEVLGRGKVTGYTGGGLLLYPFCHKP